MSSVRVCETVTATSMGELRARRDAVSRADVVELRLDGVADLDVAGALAGRRRPVVVTCRPVWDGGRFNGDESTRLALLSDASRLGAEFVDVEARAEWHRVDVQGATERILSFHDWTGVPVDLASRVAEMRRSGGMVKVAVTANRLADCIRLRDACGARTAREQVVIAMGPHGQVTRLCPWLVASDWTYGGQGAPGQVAVDELLDRYRVRESGPATDIYGIAGHPVGHSASPAMHNAAFAHLGVDAVYVPLDGDTPADVFESAGALGVKGFSVTAPFKTALASMAHAVDDRTARLGAANTLRRSGERWEARNFDVDGFLAPLDAAGVVLAGRRALVLGSGGAARAVTWALVGRGALVGIAARRVERALALAETYGARVVADSTDETWDLVVNATPLGTWPAIESRPDLPRLAPGAIAYDLVYNPPETAWLHEAARAGATVIGGLAMLVEQATRQFHWWTGLTAPRDVMADAATDFVTKELRTR